MRGPSGSVLALGRILPLRLAPTMATMQMPLYFSFSLCTLPHGSSQPDTQLWAFDGGQMLCRVEKPPTTARTTNSATHAR